MNSFVRSVAIGQYAGFLIFGCLTDNAWQTIACWSLATCCLLIAALMPTRRDHR